MELKQIGFCRENIRTLWFLGLVKNCTVGFSPMVSKTPETKRIWQEDKQQCLSVNRRLDWSQNQSIKRMNYSYIPHCQESLVKQHNDPKQWEENSKSSQAQPNLCWQKKGHRRFSNNWKKRRHCKLQVCNISTAQGAEVPQTASLLNMILYYVSSHV